MIILYLLSLFFHSIIQSEKVLHVRLLLLAETIYAWQKKTKKKGTGLDTFDVCYVVCEMAG